MFQSDCEVEWKNTVLSRSKLQADPCEVPLPSNWVKMDGNKEHCPIPMAHPLHIHFLF